MKKITLLLFAFILCGISYAQCDFDGNQYPGADQNVNNDGVVHNVSTCNYYGEYSVLLGLTIGEEYQFTNEGGYITIIDNADGSTVLSHGASPYNWTATVVDVEVHWAADAGCGTDSSCHTTTYINVTQAPSCGDPTGVSSTLTDTTADLTWSAPGSGTPTGYNWEVQPDGVAQGTAGAVDSGTSVTEMAMASGLTPETAYDFYVQADCGGDGTSNWVGPYSFTTPASPPVNDECANAIPVVCDGNYTGSTTAATDSGGNPAKDVWFSYTGSGAAEDITLDLCPSGYDTTIRVYTDCPGTNQILFNDDSDICTLGTRSYGTFASDGTSTYYIMVEGYNTSSGSFDMTVTCAPNVPAPANDLCANAEALTLDVLTAGTTAGATDDSTGNVDDTTCDSFTFKSDVWYSFVAPADGDVGIMTAITGDSDQANVAVYPDCNQLDADSLGCSVGNGGEMLDVTGLTAGNTYYVRVWSDGVAARQGNFRTEGTFTITVSDATLSTEDFTVSSDLFTYYPNPVNSNLTLNAQRDITNVVVYNMLGQQVMRSTPNTVNSEVNMTTLNPGAYFVQVTVDNKTETIRIIKN